MPGVATCSPTKLFGNYDRRHHELVGSHASAPKGARVALYNRIGTGRLAWVYGSNENGLAKVSCIATKPAG